MFTYYDLCEAVYLMDDFCFSMFIDSFCFYYPVDNGEFGVWFAPYPC